MATVIHTRKGKYQYAYKHTRKGDKVVSKYMYPVDDEGKKRVAQQKEQKQPVVAQQTEKERIAQQTKEAEDYWYEFGDCITKTAARSIVMLQGAFERVEGCVGKRGATWMVTLKIESAIKLNMGTGTQITDIKVLHAAARKWKKTQKK